MEKETAVATGRRYESFAACYLEQRGCRITDRNFRCKGGEIDLIVVDQHRKLVFVEVRFRASNLFGGALSSVTVNKQRRIRNAASYYLLTHPQYRDYYCRFDVIALSKNNQSEGVSANWIKAAFV